MAKRLTAQQRVLDCYPQAYALQYVNRACVYQNPAQAAARGRMAGATVLGTAPSIRGAWADAARRLPSSGNEPTTVGAKPGKQAAKAPTKADLERMSRLLRKWTLEESHLRSHWGERVEPGSSRAHRIKDAAALERILRYLEQIRSSAKPAANNELSAAAAGTTASGPDRSATPTATLDDEETRLQLAH